MKFCIALLDRRITRRDYDSPLICALTVLGVKEDGWKGSDQCPPILSVVIKTARFMVVQQGLGWTEQIRSEETDDENNSA